MAHKGDSVSVYDQEGLSHAIHCSWAPSITEVNPYYRTKIRLISGMIPEDVATILDVGCGNGAITNSLHSDYWVVGGDRSRKALQYVLPHPVALSAHRLPFKDQSFDLVMTHQLLEHLPTGVFERAVREVMRVTKRHLLVSVPYREHLAEAYARCTECRCVYNVFGHLRRFKSIMALRKFFEPFELKIHAFCGQENRYTAQPALWIKQRIGGGWITDESATCPRCGSASQFQAALPRRLVSSLVTRLDAVVPRRKIFWWILCLFQRGEHS